jgi:hypothetical protein
MHSQFPAGATRKVFAVHVHAEANSKAELDDKTRLLICVEIHRKARVAVV